MELKDQVCSYELSKELKEFGVKQDSYFMHCELKDVVGSSFKICSPGDLEIYKETYKHLEIEILCSAFTVAELKKYFDKIDRDLLERKLAPSDYFWIEWELQKDKIIMDLKFLAEVLIYLIKEKLMEIPK